RLVSRTDVPGRQEDRLARCRSSLVVHRLVRRVRVGSTSEARPSDAAGSRPIRAACDPHSCVCRTRPDVDYLSATLLGPLNMAGGRRNVGRFDLAVGGLLVGIGALQFAFCQAGTAFYTGDTSYLELARSIVAWRPYGFDFRPETMLPPGFPALLALLE